MMIVQNTCRYWCQCPLCWKTVLNRCLTEMCCNWRTTNWIPPKRVIHWNVSICNMVILSVWLWHWLESKFTLFAWSESSCKPYKQSPNVKISQATTSCLYYLYLPRRNGWKNLIGKETASQCIIASPFCYHGTGEATCAEGKAFRPTPSIGHGPKATSLHNQVSCHKARHSPGRKLGTTEWVFCSQKKCWIWIWFWYVVWMHVRTYGGVFFAIRFKDLIWNTAASSQNTAINKRFAELQTLPTVLTAPGKQRFGRNLQGFNAADRQR